MTLVSTRAWVASASGDYRFIWTLTSGRAPSPTGDLGHASFVHETSHPSNCVRQSSSVSGTTRTDGSPRPTPSHH